MQLQHLLIFKTMKVNEILVTTILLSVYSRKLPRSVLNNLRHRRQGLYQLSKNWHNSKWYNDNAYLQRILNDTMELNKLYGPQMKFYFATFSWNALGATYLNKEPTLSTITYVATSAWLVQDDRKPRWQNATAPVAGRKCPRSQIYCGLILW